MTAVFQSLGTVGAGATSATPGLPASLANGDLALIMAVAKPDTATINTPAGWTLVANVSGGGGTTGAFTGPTRQAWFSRVKDASWSTAPAVTITGGQPVAAVMARLTLTGGGSYDVAAATGVFGTAAAVTNCAATLGSDPGITSGDVLLGGYSCPDHTATWSAEGASAPGVTIGAATEQSEAVEFNSSGNVGGMLYTAAATAGTSTGAPSTAATSNVTTRGTVALVRVREAAPPPPPPPPPRTPEEGTARITRITHRIEGGKWTVTYGFTTEGGVAQPQVTPSPTPSGGKTLSELLRPVGEVTMWYGASGAVPAGWLLCNGAAFSGTDYPELAALLGGTTTPNMVDVFPIGAGTKALGTNGGAPTKTITAANLPSHSHDFQRATAVGATGTFPRGAATDGTTTSTGATGVAATPMDIMPPWRALHFIIRAR